MTDLILQHAAQWAIRLNATPRPDPRTQAELERWLALDPAHGPALDEALAAWRDLGDLRHAPGDLARHRLSAPPQPTRSGSRRSWRMAVAALAVILLAGLTGLGDLMVVLRADLRTGRGEVLRVTLDDGSALDLGPDSAVALSFDGRERRVELLTGRGYFAPRPATQTQGRPFVVKTASGVIQALGTRFLVETQKGDTVSVAVDEHAIRVTLADGRSGVVAEGQALSFNADGLGPLRPAPMRRATAWRDGRLIFDQQKLSEVVAELNHYRRHPIVLLAQDQRDRRVSGVFDIDSKVDPLDSVAQELGLRRATLVPFVTLLY